MHICHIFRPLSPISPHPALWARAAPHSHDAAGHLRPLGEQPKAPVEAPPSLSADAPGLLQCGKRE